jgi:hypothetical protein
MKATRREKRAMLRTVERWAEKTALFPNSPPMSSTDDCDLCRLVSRGRRLVACRACPIVKAFGPPCDCADGAFDSSLGNPWPTNESVLLTALLLCEVYKIDVEKELGWKETP